MKKTSDDRAFADKIYDCFNNLIDDRCDNFGILNTIQFLMDAGFEKQDLIRLKFDESDIDAAIAADGEIFDFWGEEENE